MLFHARFFAAVITLIALFVREAEAQSTNSSTTTVIATNLTTTIQVTSTQPQSNSTTLSTLPTQIGTSATRSTVTASVTQNNGVTPSVTSAITSSVTQSNGVTPSVTRNDITPSVTRNNDVTQSVTKNSESTTDAIRNANVVTTTATSAAAHTDTTAKIMTSDLPARIMTSERPMDMTSFADSVTTTEAGPVKSGGLFELQGLTLVLFICVVTLAVLLLIAFCILVCCCYKRRRARHNIHVTFKDDDISIKNATSSSMDLINEVVNKPETPPAVVNACDNIAPEGAGVQGSHGQIWIGPQVYNNDKQTLISHDAGDDVDYHNLCDDDNKVCDDAKKACDDDVVDYNNACVDDDDDVDYNIVFEDNQKASDDAKKARDDAKKSCDDVDYNSSCGDVGDYIYIDCDAVYENDGVPVDREETSELGEVFERTIVRDSVLLSAHRNPPSTYLRCIPGQHERYGQVSMRADEAQVSYRTESVVDSHIYSEDSVTAAITAQEEQF